MMQLQSIVARSLLRLSGLKCERSRFLICFRLILSLVDVKIQNCEKWNHQEEQSLRRLSMLEDWNYETSSSPESTGSFFSFFTGRVLRLKLIRLNRHRDRFRRSRSEDCCFKTPVLRPGRQGEQPYYVMTPEGHSPQRKWWTREFHRPLLNGTKKQLKETKIFLYVKSPFGIGS